MELEHRTAFTSVQRRTVLKGMAGITMFSVAGLAGLGAESASATTPSRRGLGSLAFDPNVYTRLTKTITTDAGDKVVVYHFYPARPYVRSPVDDTHQSLIVSVPVSVDGVKIDAAHAPIVFANGVGGYFPASVADATGVGEASMEMPTGGLPPGGGTGAPGAGGGGGGMVSIPQIALVAGFVVVEPGCRGRSLVDDDGTYYGVAPAAIVDLKAAVRYVRANKGVIPGNTDKIFTTGTSAGGALSALLGASGDSPMYSSYLRKLGAADASDSVFASGDWCPITDLEHADMAYEWNWGSNALATGATADRKVSTELSTAFADYQSSLRLSAHGFGAVTADTYGEYLLTTYLQPAATTYLAALADGDRTAYLAKNTFITWSGSSATFTWTDFLAHVGTRKKDAPAFDAFDVSAGENNLFGLGSTPARHFTKYSARRDTSGLGTKLDRDIARNLDLMNPMYHLRKGDSTPARHWWVRTGTKDSDTSLTVLGNLVLTLKQKGLDANGRMYWDAAHGANNDVSDFIAWIGKTSGYKA